MNLEIALLLLNAFSTWFMTGLIWFVQIVHYPLFDGVGVDQFQLYADRHRCLTTMVVAPPMLMEIFSSVALVSVWNRAHLWLLWLNLGFVIVIWISTALCSIPCHEKLCTSGYVTETHHWLVFSNWLRTAMWTCRAVVLAYIIYSYMAPSAVISSPP